MNDECSDGAHQAAMQKPKITFDALRLARNRESIRGEAARWSELPRLAESVLGPDALLRYEIQGHTDDRGDPGAVMVLSARLPLRCERCNEPLLFELERRVPFRFVADERVLNALPIEDDEVEEVVGSASMDLLSWIEDEAILSLPLVPRHATCELALGGGGGPVRRGSAGAVCGPGEAQAGRGRRHAGHVSFRAGPASGTISVSFRGVSHGSPTEQEIGLEAGHAPRARFPDQPADGHRADDGRGASPAPYQPERLLSRQEGRRHQERRVRRWAITASIVGPRRRPSTSMHRRAQLLSGGPCLFQSVSSR
jgi:uncharacterized protein